MNIRKLRLSKRLTQEKLAQLLGVDRTAIAKWESGDQHPRVNTIPKLARVLGCTIDDLFDAQANETKAG